MDKPSDDIGITTILPRPNRKKIGKGGYIYLSIPNHPFATKGGYYLEHRFVIEKFLKRFLEKTEVVHHINHNKQDNRICNLEVYKTSGIHIREQHSIKDRFGRFTKSNKIVLDIRKGIFKKCKNCGKKFYTMPSRKNKPFCKRKCMAKWYHKFPPRSKYFA